MIIGTQAPARCSHCQGTRFTDGPLDVLSGVYGCRDCGAEIQGPPLYADKPRKRSNVIDLDEALRARAAAS